MSGQHFDSDTHALVTGIVLGSLMNSVQDSHFLENVSPIMDGPDYTSQMTITTKSGKTFTLAVMEDQ